MSNERFPVKVIPEAQQSELYNRVCYIWTMGLNLCCCLWKDFVPKFKSISISLCFLTMN